MNESRRERDWEKETAPAAGVKLSSRLGQAERPAPNKEVRKIKFADEKEEIERHIKNNIQSRLTHVSPNKLLQFSQLSKLQKHDPGAPMASPHTPALGTKAVSPPQQSAQPPRSIISNRASPVILDPTKALPPTSPKESQQIMPPATPKEKDKQDALKNQKQL